MTANLVHYHHPDDAQFSLDFVNSDQTAIEDRLESYDETTEIRVRSYDLDEKVYVIYAKTNGIEDAENIEYSFDAAFAGMEPDTRVIVRYLLDVFESVKEKKREEESVSLDVYKDMDVGRLPDALERVDWSGTVPQVGGQLASNVVLCHALPNANHRTAFGLFEGYANATAGPVFELPSMRTDDYEWRSWVDDYVVASKRLLTVRRNTALFSHLREFGCKRVRRKGDIDIVLAEYDLDLHPGEALSEYATRHEHRTRTFTEKILERTNNGDMRDRRGLTKSAFADSIREKI